MSPKHENAPGGLPAIPHHQVAEADWPLALLDLEIARARMLLTSATRLVPSPFIALGDRVSRRWLSRGDNRYLGEIDAIGHRIGRAGACFLNVSYEWGCTSRSGASPDGAGAQLLRVLDWPHQGIGQNVVALTVDSPLGAWTNLTWPGFAGVIQASAPGRFAAAFNQAPMNTPTGVLATDWLAARMKLWVQRGLPPAHLLREVFETAANFAEARQMLKERPIAAPAIFILSGVRPEEGCVIERLETQAVVHRSPAVAANHWLGRDWSGRSRGDDSHGRARGLSSVHADFSRPFDWLVPPVLNRFTRLVMLAEPAGGRLAAQGWEPEGVATEVLRIDEPPSAAAAQ
jgi:hypothetical protein